MFVNGLWAVIDFLEKYNGAVTAIATVFIGVFTYVLARVTNRQAKLTREGIELTRKEFVATHRPRVIIRFIQGPFVSDDNRQFIWVIVANIGDSATDIEEFGGDLARRRGTHWLTPGAAGDPKRIEPITLMSGQRHVFTVTAKRPYGDAEIFSDATGASELCAFGAIRYRDDNDVLRETGYFRVYDSERDAFLPSKDESEEYQD
jgi:hypothetical protein